MTTYTRDELIARLIRAGELEVSGENPEEQATYFAPSFRWHGPDGAEADADGLAQLFADFRDGFDDRTIRRGIMLVDGSFIACQTWIEGTFVRHYAGSPVGPLPPTGKRLVWPIHNIFQFDDHGRLLEEWVQYDNRSLLRQLGVNTMG